MIKNWSQGRPGNEATGAGEGLGTRLPVASTCAPAISLPTMYRAYGDFKTVMIEGIVGGFGFGLHQFGYCHHVFLVSCYVFSSYGHFLIS